MATETVPYGRVTQKKPAVAEIHIVWITAGLGCDGDTVAITAATQDRAAVKVHDIGLRLHRNHLIGIRKKLVKGLCCGRELKPSCVAHAGVSKAIDNKIDDVAGVLNLNGWAFS
jgi:hypothetical protein